MRVRVTIAVTSVTVTTYETWSATLREEHGARVFENRVLRGMVRAEGGTNRKVVKVA